MFSSFKNNQKAEIDALKKELENAQVEIKELTELNPNYAIKKEQAKTNTRKIAS